MVRALALAATLALARTLAETLRVVSPLFLACRILLPLVLVATVVLAAAVHWVYSVEQTMQYKHIRHLCQSQSFQHEKVCTACTMSAVQVIHNNAHYQCTFLKQHLTPS